jgi:UPF0755 protein
MHAPTSPGARDVDRPRRVGLAVFLLILLPLGGAIVAGWRYYQGCRETPDEGAAVRLDVPEGATGDEVVELLSERGLLRCGGIVGGMLLRDTGKQGAVLAGEYSLRRGMTLDEIVTILTTPPEELPTVEVLFPEGLRIRTTYPGERTVASIARDELGLSAERLADLAESGKLSLRPYLPKGASTLEGFLFPKTYEFVRRGVDERTVLQTMLDQFHTEVEGLPWDAAEELGLTPYEVVIVASMIEREAKVDDERALIAGVIYNRLAQGWTLGIDATLLYDDPTPDGELTTADIETDTPYNTRINAGLPPTPIANPGLASIRAALQPRSTDFMFYVLCGDDGSHRFSRTLAEHEANVDACLG